jgi:hypothetical protein
MMVSMQYIYSYLECFLLEASMDFFHCIIGEASRTYLVNEFLFYMYLTLFLKPSQMTTAATNLLASRHF